MITDIGLTTPQKIVLRQPAIQMIIYSTDTKQLFQRFRGDDWQWNRTQTATMYFNLEVNFERSKYKGHLRAIKDIRKYFDLGAAQHGSFFCDYCLVNHNEYKICDVRQLSCDMCGADFASDELLEEHQQKSGFERRMPAPA